MRIQNARQNNLKNLNLEIPENQLIAVTGLSGSGKSSLAMGVIANEGYRYFLESLPAYNQQNSQAIPTAEVDRITDLPPVIKVEQSKRFQSIKTTFGTLSELASIFRILFARYSGERKMSKSLFSFNHPKGACDYCRGIGEAEYIDLDKLIGDENKTLREGAITTTLPHGYIVYSQVRVEELNKVCEAHGFSVDIPWKNLTEDQKQVVLRGSERVKVYYGKHSLESRLRWQGLKAKPREEGYYKGILPIMEDILRLDRNKSILRFVSAKTCPKCNGARIKPEHLKFKWKGRNFQQWMALPLNELYKSLQAKIFEGGEQVLVDQLCTQLFDLIGLGMGSYSLATESVQLSSGDAQRIKLIKQVNSSLQGILYVFDEPSIGLSEVYQKHLLHILKRLIYRGNTVMVVEHDLEFIKSADWIVELGPEAGSKGGDILFNGPTSKFLNNTSLNSPTLAALESEKTNKKIPKPTENLSDFTLREKSLTVVSRQDPSILKTIENHCQTHGLKAQKVTDQPIGKTPRSNPSTYTGLATKIRNLLAKTPEAKEKKLTKSAFSFNNKKGRCPNCEGAGVITLSMSAMGSINQVCPVCNGKRFKPEILEVPWKGKNIAHIYDLSIEEAYGFFEGETKLTQILSLMVELGLGYVKLGQPSNTLSGGEAQRIKLTKHFAKSAKNTVLILEEPSIGLHQQNVEQLITALQRLKQKTAAVICFETHTSFQNQADSFIDNAQAPNTEKLLTLKKQQHRQIVIKGARTHSLKNLDIKLPKNKLSVVTGISGSGKSSLVIDTLHGFGLQEMSKQFSSYQRSRVGVNFQMDVDYIEGLTPSICITRKQKNFSPRSDVAKQTDIDKSLRFAFSRKAQAEGKDWSASHFSNNHELGMCSICDGMGQEMLPALYKLVLDSHKSIADGLFEHNKALAYYGQPEGKHMAILEEVGKANGFDLHTPFQDMTGAQRNIVLNGIEGKEWEAQWKFKTRTREGVQQVKMEWIGLNGFLTDEYLKTRKNKHTKTLKSLFSPNTCSHCSGSGLKPERLGIKILNRSIYAWKCLDFREFEKALTTGKPNGSLDDQLVAKIKDHLKNILEGARQLHIDYLQLNRKSATLSGGEQQRVALIKQLNSPLTGVTYLLDEPSAGLSQDNLPDLIRLLKELIAKGNTVIVIEHEKELILAADQLLEIGPQAGSLGGYLTFQGTPEDYLKTDQSHPYLKSSKKPVRLAKTDQYIQIENVQRYSLNKKKLDIPIGGITALTGKSGVGKTTLVKDIILPSIGSQKPINCGQIQFPTTYTGADYFEPKKLRAYNRTLLVDYLSVLNEVTKVFARETDQNAHYFSYKNKKSQCPTCKGRGYVETSLDVAANYIEQCDTCNGTRYRDEVLTYTIDGLSIADILAKNLAEAHQWLNAQKANAKTLQFLKEMEQIGLAHLQLDQAVKSLSSGEQQRLLLLNWLQGNTENQLYILDEPSTGLHYADIDLLFTMLTRLSQANDILVIDHNPYLLEKIGKGMVLR